MGWKAVQNHIERCRLCEDQAVPHLFVPPHRKRHPTLPPAEEVRVYFVAVAPPFGGDYFWDEGRDDKLRRCVFAFIEEATGQRLTGVRAFRDAGYYLTPSVKCPSQDAGRDRHPPPAATRNCGPHLLDELRVVRPRRILAFGKLGMAGVVSALGLTDVPERVQDFAGRIWMTQLDGTPCAVSGTYYPGNNRHRQAASVSRHLRALLDAPV